MRTMPVLLLTQEIMWPVSVLDVSADMPSNEKANSGTAITSIMLARTQPDVRRTRSLKGLTIGHPSTKQVNLCDNV